MNARSVYPEHFFAAIDHALALLAAGTPYSLISVMGKASAQRGLVDAASGYEHALLMMMGR